MADIRLVEGAKVMIVEGPNIPIALIGKLGIFKSWTYKDNSYVILIPGEREAFKCDRREFEIIE